MSESAGSVGCPGGGGGSQEEGSLANPNGLNGADKDIFKLNSEAITKALSGEQGKDGQLKSLSTSDDSDDTARQFNEMKERFPTSMSAKDFDKATNLDDAVNEIMMRYAINTGDYSDLDVKLAALKGPTILPQFDNKPFLMDKVDPRAFDVFKLELFSLDRGYKINSGVGDKRTAHGEFSFHYDGRAIDIGVKGLNQNQISAIIKAFSDIGVRTYDETQKKNWTSHTTGYHLHFDTGTAAEIRERTAASKKNLTRDDLGLGHDWPLRQRP